MVAPLLALGILGAASALGYSLSRSNARASGSGSDQGDRRAPRLSGPAPEGAQAGRGRGGFYQSTIRDLQARMSAPSDKIDTSVAQWAPFLAPGCVRYGIQLPYALKWVDLESGGNPCEVGYPPAHGTGGPWPNAPREMGIVQFYNPDDLQALGLTADALRAYCVPGDQHPTTFNGKVVRGFSQAATRALTPAEMTQQADGAIGLIRQSMTSATRDLIGVRAGPSWSPSTRNYWALVKLQHGLPQVSHVGLSAVTKHLGRPPNSWHEFRTTLADVRLDDATEKKYRADFDRVLDNAEACASVVAEEAVA
jgi:hypothetical protein